MTSTVLEKVKKPKGVNKKKPKMSYFEALEYIEKCDAAIKIAAQSRLPKPVSLEQFLFDRSMNKSMILGGGVSVVSIGTLLSGVSPFQDSILGATASALGLVIIPLINSGLGMSSTWTRLASPVKYSAKERELSQALAEWTQAEAKFEEVATAIRAKAKKAVEIINANVLIEGKAVKYSNTRGSEGFDIVQTGPVSGIQQAKLSVLKTRNELSSLQSVTRNAPLELESPENTVKSSQG